MISDRDSFEQPTPEARLTLNPHCGLPKEAWARVGEIAKGFDLSWFQLLDDGMICAPQSSAQRFAIAAAGWADREGHLLVAPLCSIIPMARRAPTLLPNMPQVGISVEEQPEPPKSSAEAARVEAVRATVNRVLAADSVPQAAISDAGVQVKGATTEPSSVKGDTVPWLAVVLSLGLLGGAFVGSWSGMYYIVLRSAVSFTAASLASDLWEHARQTAIGLIVVALVFNPFLPIYLGDRGPWLVIDGIAGALILFAQLISRLEERI